MRVTISGGSGQVLPQEAPKPPNRSLRDRGKGGTAVSKSGRFDLCTELAGADAIKDR